MTPEVPCQHEWEDVGECSEGCCDKFKCKKCGRVEYEEVGQ